LDFIVKKRNFFPANARQLNLSKLPRALKFQTFPFGNMIMA